MSPPLVSIVIPGHNQGRYLADSVDSAVGQSYPGVEVIVVDNASTDETDAVAGRYGDRIHYIKKPDNSGASAARNTGIAAAQGAYLKFVDADDSLHPDQVAWQMEALAGRTDAVSFTTTQSGGSVAFACRWACSSRSRRWQVGTCRRALSPALGHAARAPARGSPLASQSCFPGP